MDALITDPPYGTTELPWDRKLDLSLFWTQAHRVCKERAIIVLFSQQPFTSDLIHSNRKAFRYELIWHKTAAVGWLSANSRPLRAHENILIFARRFRGSTYHPQKRQGKPYRPSYKGAARHYGRQRGPSVRALGVPTSGVPAQASSNNGAGSSATIGSGERYPRSVLLCSNRNTPSLHPTQKPLDLMLWLVQSYSHVGDVVLDPFMGSGSTGAACRQTGRSFIGIEREREYFEVAKERLQRHDG